MGQGSSLLVDLSHSPESGEQLIQASHTLLPHSNIFFHFFNNQQILTERLPG